MLGRLALHLAGWTWFCLGGISLGTSPQESGGQTVSETAVESPEPVTSEADGEFFTARIAPLLVAKCIECHSHATGQMEGGLTLDSKGGWTNGGDRGPALIPGDPEASLLIRAVRYQDAELQMPPDDPLSQAEQELLVDWVRRGAPDPRQTLPDRTPATNWWSLMPMEMPPVPGDGAVEHSLDAFIWRRLEAEGLRPAKPADKVALVRRLYVDLHGYLPTPDEVQAFVANEDPRAYEQLIDDLLASPRYGERWARHWLDVVHFADSHGCEHDVKRPHAWRYRDYVIERLNADVAWGDFIREQLAADVFFPDQPELTTALGFIAAGPLELSRAGTAPVTFDYLDRDDMVTQTMAAFVSTTANCARCHTHKFDPISQEDYYALQAVFAGVGKGDVQYEPSRSVRDQRRAWQAVLAAVATRDSAVLLDDQYAEEVAAWVSAQQQTAVRWSLLEPEVFASAGGATLTRQQDGSLVASGPVPDEEVYTLVSPIPVDRVAGARVTGVRLEVLADQGLPQGGPGRAGNGNLHLSEVQLQWFPANADQGSVLRVKRASADFDQEGWDASQAIDGDLKTGWAIFPRVNESHHIVFALASPLDVSEGGRLLVTLKQHYPPKHVIGRMRLAITDAPTRAVTALPREVVAGLAKSAGERDRDESLSIAALALQELAERELAKLPPQETVYAVSANWSHAKRLESPQAIKPVHLLRRGAFDQPVREVQPGALLALESLRGRFDLPAGHDESARRAALANWLADRDNPLTWRSIVNRVWHFHFGRGLSDTPNDFGRMGSVPTHPELLDWLALWFRDEAKGSLKQLHRLILTSEAWRRTSLADMGDRDPTNRYLWRMNRRRMEAEVFRDTVLRMAGRLELTMGGPGVEQFAKTKGPQATPMLDYTAYDWESPGANRRSIYRVVWRGIPDPFMESLDFPDLGLLAPKRGQSISALQSLTLFNNDFVLHGSEWIADRLGREVVELDEQVARAVELAWSRKPSPAERETFVAFAEQHGLAAFCRVLLNSNAFLFVD